MRCRLCRRQLQSGCRANNVDRAGKQLCELSFFIGKKSVNQTVSNEKKKRNHIFKMVALPEKMLLILIVCVHKFYWTQYAALFAQLKVFLTALVFKYKRQGIVK